MNHATAVTVMLGMVLGSAASPVTAQSWTLDDEHWRLNESRMGPVVPPSQIEVIKADGEEGMTLVLPSGDALTLDGEYGVDSDWQAPFALVIRSRGCVAVVDAGAMRPRTIYRPITNRQTRGIPAWSVDGSRYYDWLDTDMQLVEWRVDREEGRTIQEAPVGWRPPGSWYLKPQEVGFARKVFDDAARQRLISVRFEKEEEGFLGFGPDRDILRFQFIGLEDSEDGMQVSELMPWREGTVAKWDFDPTHQRLVVALTDDSGSAIMVFGEGGKVIEEFRGDVFATRHVDVTPDGRHMLGERPWKGQGAPWGRGFFVLDLEDGQVVYDATRGHDASLSPDGRRIAYYDDKRFGCVDWQREEAVLEGHWLEGAVPPSIRWYSGRPAWSPDGRLISFALTGALDVRNLTRNRSHVLVFNLEERKLVTIAGQLDSMIWSPHPHPFR